MKKTILLVTCILSAATLLVADDEVESRLRHMDCIVPVKTDASTLSRIQSLLRSRKETEKMIGRSATYFPIFDQYIKEYNLPPDLKYITCLETELNNKVVSSSGAKGIWQLMSDVKEEFGLRIDGVLDERLDIYRGTEAALKDLKRIYKAYNSWELALAGYNCGVGRLSDAMKKAKSNDFSRVRAFLPKQTQEYISKFIAFTYVMKNYTHHGLKYYPPLLDAQLVASVKVYNHLSLSTVASITGVPYEFIKELNLHLGEGYVPDTEGGCNVLIPRRVMGALQDYISSADVKQQPVLNFTPMVIDPSLPKLEGDPNYFKTSYMAGDGETIEAIADLFNVGVYNIVLWNHLESPRVSKGQELTLFMPRVVPKRP